MSYRQEAFKGHETLVVGESQSLNFSNNSLAAFTSFSGNLGKISSMYVVC